MSSPGATAVMYLRVSTKEQAERGGSEGFSIPAQREACRRKAEALGAVVVDEFADRGESARSADRPQLQAMLAHLQEQPTTYVIVHKVDRLARNRADDVAINLAIKQAGCALVSCTENIDETPSGILMHGIMSSIAEFYSSNLANEVKKGSLQKAKAGGTIGRAPVGYRNIRTMVEGREVRTIDVDPDRGPLMTWVFERYAKGDINVRDLLAEATDRGLNSRPGPNTPSKPLSLSNFCRLLKHPYYRGKVRYKGVVYDGNHEPLVDDQTWHRVQELLETRGRAGEKQRKHDHYLKGTVYCGQCGSRLIVSHNRSRTGRIYPYFLCVGRQQKRTDCTQKAVGIDHIEYWIERWYEHFKLSPELLEALRSYILDELDAVKGEAETQYAAQSSRRSRLVKEQEKLLQAHYADAVPLELMKSEQKRITNELDAIDRQLASATTDHSLVVANLEAALDYVDRVGTAYQNADDKIRRGMNQGIFKRVEIDQDGITRIQLTELFEALLEPNFVKRAVQAVSAEEATPSAAEAALLELSFDDVDRLWEMVVDSWKRSGDHNEQTPELVGVGGLKDNHLVGVEGLEPPTLSV